MANKTSKTVFKFQPFSKKQRMVLNWWTDASPVADADGIIADGAIRSGKTLCMSLSFVLWAMETFDGQNFAMCGKTVGSFRRNVLFWLKMMLNGRGYKFEDRRSENLLIVTKGNKENFFYIFGGRDERSQDLIQGITLAGVFLDEVALMPESFVNQATGRCSVDGSRMWFNCNPEHPQHWFKAKWIDKADEKRLLYLHFTMDDNLSLSDAVKERYRRMYTGVWFLRFIRGQWVAAEGACYPLFAADPERFTLYQAPPIAYANIGVDFGGGTSGHAFQCVGFTFRMKEMVVLEEYFNKDALDPTTLADEFVAFARMCVRKYTVSAVYCDSAEQTLINGLRNAAAKAGLPVNIYNSLKKPINERIRAACLLMGEDRFKVMAHCTVTRDAYCAAVYDAKQLTTDVRLDNGTSNVDQLDATEYAYEREIDDLLDAS
jgi:PBSX family phage terminase large subunit